MSLFFCGAGALSVGSESLKAQKNCMSTVQTTVVVPLCNVRHSLMLHLLFLGEDYLQGFVCKQQLQQCSAITFNGYKELSNISDIHFDSYQYDQ